MTFKLQIKLGNDAMQTGVDIADALRTHADLLEEYSNRQLANSGKHGIRDTNGNTVGFWTVAK